MRHMTLALALLALVGCKGTETGFQQGTGTNATEEGGGGLEIYPTELVWTDLSAGVTASEYVKITSIGEEPLMVYDVGVVDSADGQFSVEGVEEFELQPGGTREFTVQCTLAADAPAAGELRIKNNDADQLDLRITLTATPLGYTDTGEAGGDTGDSGAGG